MTTSAGTVGDHGRPSSARTSQLIATPADPEEASGALWQEVRQRFAWYDRAANRNRWAYYAVKLVFLIGGAAVTVLAAISAPAMITAILAGAIVVIEGIQQLFRFHANWISYRATAETIRVHAFAYVAEVEPYDDGRNRRTRLAEFLRDLALRENSTWSRIMRTSNPRSAGTT
jgi:hypothetical protein